MRRNIGAVAQTMLRNEIRTSEGHSNVAVDAELKQITAKPEKKTRYEGKKQFNLILPESLYQEIKLAADTEARSMNSYIVFAIKQALKLKEE